MAIFVASAFGMAYAARLLQAMPAPKGRSEAEEERQRGPNETTQGKDKTKEVPKYGACTREGTRTGRATALEDTSWNGWERNTIRKRSVGEMQRQTKRTTELTRRVDDASHLATRAGQRVGYVPKHESDYGGGGAFPEVHVVQYPMGMGKKQTRKSAGTQAVVPVTAKEDGSVAYDAIVKQGENRGRNVFTDKSALMPKRELMVPENLQPPSKEELEDDVKATEAALGKVVEAKLAATRPKHIATQSKDPTYIKYTPQGAGGEEGKNTRIIQMHEMPVDPLEPPKFKYKKVPKGTGDAPVPVLHAPPKKLTREDMESWKIPPCISNWKNSKGYTIPLDKRLAADGRSLEDVQINDQFAKFSEALYVAEQKARESVEMRAKIQRELAMKEKEKKEEQLRELAMQARMERARSVPERYPGPPSEGAPTGSRSVANQEREMAYPPPPPLSGSEAPMERAGAREGERYPSRDTFEHREEESREERLARERRDEIREERRRERDRERRLEASGQGKRSKLARDRDRDISERVALGQAHVQVESGEAMYDQRLFNQEEGMGAGFAAEDAYNLYDKPLFADRSAVTGLYRSSAVEQQLSEDEELERVHKTSRFKPTKGFAGTEGKVEPRTQPVQFEKEVDPFGIDDFLVDVRQGRKEAPQEPGMGTMAASAGGATSDAGWSSRTRVNFQKGTQE